MNNFINNILTRHLDPGKNIVPRLRGKFEAGTRPSLFSAEPFGEDPIPAIGLTRNNTQQTEQLNDNTILPEDHLSDKPQEIQSPVLQAHLPVNKIAVQPGAKSQPAVITSTRSNEARQPVDTGKKYFEKHQTQNEHPINRHIKNLQIPDNNINVNDRKITLNRKNIDHIADGKSTDMVRPAVPKVSALPNSPEAVQSIIPAAGTLGHPPAMVTQINQHKVGVNYTAEENAAPVIKVSIGQIHVKATMSSPADTKKTPRPVNKPSLSLEEYLKSRG